MYKPTKINFQTFIRKTFHQKKKYLSKLTPVILRSKGLAPVHICPQKNPPTKITDQSPTQQPKNPMCHPWSCKSKMRRASKAGEKKKKKKIKNRNGNTCPTRLRKELIPKHTRLKEFGLPNALTHPKPRSTTSIQLQHYYHPCRHFQEEGAQFGVPQKH